jgi:acetyl-CoA acetyltransferase
VTTHCSKDDAHARRHTIETAVIVDAVRSPIGRGKPGGVLSSVHAVELLAQVFRGLMARNDLDPGLVDDVIVGCVSQAADQASRPRTSPPRASWRAPTTSQWSAGSSP